MSVNPKICAICILDICTSACYTCIIKRQENLNIKQKIKKIKKVLDKITIPLYN